MSGKTKILLIGLIVVIVAGVAAFLVSTDMFFDAYEQQIRLGYRFLTELEFEQAIIAFGMAIEIDPRRDRAYIGKADTFFAMGEHNLISDDEMLERISEILSEGFEMSQSQYIADTYIRLADLLIEREQENLALRLLMLGYAALERNERLNIRIGEIVDIRNLEFLRQMFNLLEAGNIYEAKVLMRTDAFLQVRVSLNPYFDPENPWDNRSPWHGYAFYSPTSTRNAKSGSAITISSWGEVFHGNFHENQRNGYGMAITHHMMGPDAGFYCYHTFTGYWIDNQRHGAFEDVHVDYHHDGRIDRQITTGVYNIAQNGPFENIRIEYHGIGDSSYERWRKEIITGNKVNWREDGTIYRVVEDRWGGSFTERQYFTNGVPAVLESRYCEWGGHRQYRIGEIIEGDPINATWWHYQQIEWLRNRAEEEQ